MGPEGIRALVYEMERTNRSARDIAVGLLRTAPNSDTAEVVSVLRKLKEKNDPSIMLPVIFSLENLQRRLDQPLQAYATNWVEPAGATVKDPLGLWDARRETRVIGTSGLIPGFW